MQLVCVFVFMGGREGGRGKGGEGGRGDQRRYVHKTSLNLLTLKYMHAEPSHAKQSRHGYCSPLGRHEVID